MNDFFMSIITHPAFSTATLFIGFLVGNHFSIYRDRRQEFNRAVAGFHAAFAPALAQIDLSKRHGRSDVSPAPDVEKFRSASLLEQATAIETFRVFVPESQKTKYQEAWENYRSEVAFGFVTNSLREDIDDPHAMYDNLIHNILAFAKSK